MFFNKGLKYGKIDWYLTGCYLLLVLIGWLNIFAALYSDDSRSILDFSQRYGMQFIWIVTSLLIAGVILFIIDAKAYSVLSPLFYLIILGLLILVIFMGKEINGSKSWFVLGPVSFQPAEISKISTSLFLSYIMSKYGFRLGRLKDAMVVAVILLLPMLLIIMEKETGSALVYAGFIFVLYREGLSGWVIIFGLLAIFLFVVTLAFSPLTAIICLTVILGIANGLMCRKLFRHLLFLVPLIALLIFLPHLTEWEPVKKANLPDPEYLALILLLPVAVTMAAKGFTKKYPHTKYMILSLICSILLIFSVDFIFENIMQEHQRTRIENLLGLKEDLKGAGYNVHQSKIAIGSGGLTGKGFLQGTQTKYNFVPEQSTDFIFCTIGEEWGFVGSALTVIVYVFLIGRILNLAEKQKDSFARLYGYCIASCFFMHFFINIGMTMGLVPVIGIPLPFLSYGGSSLWTFTILLFIFIKLDSERWNY